MPSTDDSVDEEVMEEGCYHLSRLGLTPDQLAMHFGTTPARVGALVRSYEAKLSSGKVVPVDVDRTFWEDVKKEAEGDVKLTFLSDKGFHHGWKSELMRLDGPALMSVYEASRDFLNADPNRKFLEYPPPRGFDPLALDREIKKAVGVIGELLDKKWREVEGRGEAAKP